MLAFLFLLFPTGHLRSRRWRPAAWFAGGVFALATVWMLIVATDPATHRAVRALTWIPQPPIETTGLSAGCTSPTTGTLRPHRSGNVTWQEPRRPGPLGGGGCRMHGVCPSRFRPSWRGLNK
jgi:hypothetical protein